jgi:hypothetical protein
MIKKSSHDPFVDLLDGNAGSLAPIAQMRCPVHVTDAAPPRIPGSEESVCEAVEMFSARARPQPGERAFCFGESFHHDDPSFRAKLRAPRPCRTGDRQRSRAGSVPA